MYNLKSYDADLIDSMNFEQQVLIPMVEDARRQFPKEAEQILESYNKSRDRVSAYIDIKTLLNKLEY